MIYLTLHVPGHLAEEGTVEPRSIDDVGDEEWDADEGRGQIGHRQVNQKEILGLAHVRVAVDCGDEESIASDGDNGDRGDEDQQGDSHL